METKTRSHELGLADLAVRQHGVVSVAQLLRLGCGRAAIKWRVQAGRLHRIHRGVYAVGHPRIGYFGRCMAAVLASGDDAALSHRAAGQLWGLRTGSWIEVTVPRGRHGPRSVGLHETRRIPPVTEIDNIPLTTLGRTLVDLADVMSHTRLEGAFADAERLRILDLADVQPIHGRRGAARLRRVLGDLYSADTQPGLEQQFASFLRDCNFPWPLFNTLVEGNLVDAFWPEQRLVAELDSYEYHGKARKPFEEDRAKDIRLQLAGYRVIRVTSRMLDSGREELARQLAAFLG
jgi:hypothetical protein